MQDALSTEVKTVCEQLDKLPDMQDFNKMSAGLEDKYVVKVYNYAHVQ